MGANRQSRMQKSRPSRSWSHFGVPSGTRWHTHAAAMYCGVATGGTEVWTRRSLGEHIAVRMILEALWVSLRRFGHLTNSAQDSSSPSDIAGTIIPVRPSCSSELACDDLNVTEESIE